MKFPEKIAQTATGELFYYTNLKDHTKTVTIFLHGLSSNHTTWLPTMRHLAEEGDNVLAPDLRGHGKSDKRKIRSVYKWPVLVDDLEAVVEAEGIKRVIIVGYSYGGPIALEYARRHPEKTVGLILISANLQSPPVGMGLGFTKPLLYWGLRLLGFLLLWQRRRQYLYFEHGKASGYWDSTWTGINTMPWSVNAWMFSQMFDLDVRSICPQVSAPVLVVRGHHDPFVSSKESEAMVALLPDAKLVEADDVGHFIASRSQHALTNLIADFLHTYAHRHLQ